MKKLLIYLLLPVITLACNSQANKDDQTQKDSTQNEVATQSTDKKEATSKSENPTMGLKIAGSFYSPLTKEMLLAKWDGKKITKLFYAPKGADKFVNVTITEQTGNLDDLEYSFTFQANGKTLKAIFGISPGGTNLNVSEVGNEATTARDFGLANEETPVEDTPYKVAFYVREIFWNGFKNEENMSTIIAEDSQEGTAEGQLNITYTDPAGEEEYIAAQVDSRTHHLNFTSKNMGTKVRCELDNEMRWVMRVYNVSTGKKIGDYKQIISEAP